MYKSLRELLHHPKAIMASPAMEGYSNADANDLILVGYRSCICIEMCSTPYRSPQATFPSSLTN